MSEFERAFTEACELAFHETLGNSATASTVYHLSRAGVALTDCARRPLQFDDVLSQIFPGAGAVLVEGGILKRFYRVNVLGCFEWSKGLNFCEEVGKARAVFELRGERRTKH